MALIVNQPSGPLSPEARQNLLRNRMARGVHNAGLNINLTPEIISSAMSRLGGVMPGQNAINDFFASLAPKTSGPMMQSPITNMGPGMGMAPVTQMPRPITNMGPGMGMAPQVGQGNQNMLYQLSPQEVQSMQADLANQNFAPNPRFQMMLNQPPQQSMAYQNTMPSMGMGVQQFLPSGMQSGMGNPIGMQMPQAMSNMNNPQFRGLLG